MTIRTRAVRGTIDGMGNLAVFQGRTTTYSGAWWLTALGKGFTPPEIV